MKKNILFRKRIILGIYCLCFLSCNKLVSITPPIGSVVASQLFSNNGEATSAVAGMYSTMINTSGSYANSGVTIGCGLSADELIFFGENNGFNPDNLQLQQNELTGTNGIVSGDFWNPMYFTIYQANSVIQGLEETEGVNGSVKNELIGESEFVRAFCNFYLVNLFGDIPLVTTIDYQKTSLLSRTPTNQVYQAIIADLKDAQIRLAADYSAGQGQRIIPNKWAATALLARVYLYTGDWQDAITASSSVIGNTGLFGLVPLNQIFLANSNEAIWQLQQSNTIYPWFNITPEASLIIPNRLNTNQPSVYLTNNLLNAFEPGDQRKTVWIDTTLYANVEYYFPFKYQQGPMQSQVNGPYIEYYMVLRLGEQFLIRAEAEAHGAGNGVSGAISDLNVIRNRAGLPGYAGATDQSSVLNAIYHERQIELFAEWGHRWLDLKRWGNAAQILSADKGINVSKDALLYPIPSGELTADPNLRQNPGY